MTLTDYFLWGYVVTSMRRLTTNLERLGTEDSSCYCRNTPPSIIKVFGHPECASYEQAVGHMKSLKKCVNAYGIPHNFTVKCASMVIQVMFHCFIFKITPLKTPSIYWETLDSVT